MYMSEEESFWMLHCIARGERYLLNGLWSPGFPLLFQCFYQFSALLRKHCPRLSAHLLSQEQPITPELYATHWFMTLFSYNLPFDVVLRVWDILLAEGPKIIFRLAIFACKHMEKDILAEKEFASILDILKNLHKNVSAGGGRMRGEHARVCSFWRCCDAHCVTVLGPPFLPASFLLSLFPLPSRSPSCKTPTP